jgi:hypothetical protein
MKPVNPTLRICLASFVVALVGARAPAARAQGAAPPDAPASGRAEARERFDRGLKLFEEGDNAGALAEFKRAYELVPNPQVLFNIGLVYAAMNRPVEATLALGKLLAAPGGLAADRLARARALHAEQEQRVGLLRITTNVPAAIDVDGVDTGKTPLGEPLRVAGGTHLVGVAAPGHLPARKEVTVAGGATAEIAFELTATETKLARVELRTRLPGVDVYVDGEVMGRTPILSAMSVAAGRHTVELRRRGYVTGRRELELREGATAEVALDLVEDVAASAADRGRLVVAASEPEAEVTVDGLPRGLLRAPLSLPVGPHRLRVERGGFEPLERDIDLPAGSDTTIRVTLRPTPETRATFVESARSRRVWGWVTLLGGAALAAGGGVLGVVASGDVTRARKETDALEASRKPMGGGACDPAAGKDCSVQIDAAYDRLNQAKLRRTVGLVGAGVGVAALLVGGVLLLGGEASDKYDRGSTGEAFALRPFGLIGPGGGGLGLGARF